MAIVVKPRRASRAGAWSRAGASYRRQTARGADGGRRIDAPDDLVRLEIATALAREDMRVIPVLVDGAEVPSATDLPLDLRPLARRNAISLTEADWRSEAAALMGEIEWIMGADVVFTEAPERVRDPKVETPLVRYDGWRAVRRLWMPLVGLAGLLLVGLGQLAGKGWWVAAGIVYLIITFGQVPQLMSGHPRTYVITQIVGTAHLVWAQRHYRRMVVGPPS